LTRRLFCKNHLNEFPTQLEILPPLIAFSCLPHPSLSRSGGRLSRRSAPAPPTSVRSRSAPAPPTSARSRLLVYLCCDAASFLPRCLGPRTVAACEDTAAGKGWIFPAQDIAAAMLSHTVSARSARTSSNPCSAFDPACHRSPLLSELIPNQGHSVRPLRHGLPPHHRLQLLRQGHGASPNAMRQLRRRWVAGSGGQEVGGLHELAAGHPRCLLRHDK
jgi:hypothetical protein